MVISNGAFSMVYLNPPYDDTISSHDDEGTERKEFIELHRNTRYLMDGGLMIFCVSSYTLANPKIARHLATTFTNVAICRFSSEDYADYKQCYFIGRKKKSAVKKFEQGMYDFLIQMDNEEFVMSKVHPINHFIGKYTVDVPTTSKTVKTFYTRQEGKDMYYEGINQSKGFAAFKARLMPKQLEMGGKPIIPLSQGQLALLLGSGMLNGMIGTGDNLHLVQGIEDVRNITEVEKTENGTKTITRTKREVTVKYITPSGLIRKLV